MRNIAVSATTMITTIISVIRPLQLTASCGFVGVNLGHGGKS
jgi:hypothetical protein